MSAFKGVQSNQESLGSADSLFKAGKFAEAEKLYAEALAVDLKNVHALVRLASIALLANRLDDAQRWLTQAIELKADEPWLLRFFSNLFQKLLRPEEPDPKAILAEVFYRRDDFQQAAPLLRATGEEAKAKKLESFKGVTPYQIDSEAEVTHLKFVMTDPLPVVQVRVNGSEPVNFFIDTGGAEVFIDTEFAKEVGAAQFGSETGFFGGGKQADFQHGRVDSLTLSGFVIKNVPVNIMDIRRFSQPVFGGKRVDGVIGTFLLYHFLATLDYPQGELILQRKTKENLKRLEEKAQAEKQIVVPFWMAEYCMVTWGTVNKSQPLLLFVDTGLAGAGFTCPESTLKEASVKLQESLAGEGIGGGGKMMSIPFGVEELTLGDARERNIQGVYGAFPPQLENAFGFRIGGLISHEFFRPYALTLDFTGMRYFLERKE